MEKENMSHAACQEKKNREFMTGSKTHIYTQQNLSLEVRL